MSRPLRLVLLCQAAYYVVNGLISLVSRDLFEAVTGPKSDYWLVRMVGLLAVVIGLGLGIGARAGRRTPELMTLAIGSALAFAAIDLVYGLSGVISPIYVADGVLELGLAAAVLGLSLRSRA
ncbi:MAG: hypothetical protein ACREOC_07690 [Gemmatimonadales bacterium]